MNVLDDNATFWKHDFSLRRIEQAQPPSTLSLRSNELQGWVFYSAPQLPVASLYNSTGSRIGLILGFWISTQTGGELSPSELHLDSTLGEACIDDAAQWVLENLLGRFALLLCGTVAPRWYPDASGSLSAVYDCNAQVIASRPNLCEPNCSDPALTKAIGDIRNFSGTWYPAGICNALNIRIILANHYLCLEDWRLIRMWPLPNAFPKCAEKEVGRLTQIIIREIREYVVAVARRYPVTLNLTSGRDSRMLLACCRGQPLERVLFHTLPNPGADLDIARIITDHFSLPFVVSEKPPSDRVLLQGLGGEVGRCFYWHEGDLQGVQPTVEALLNRLGWGDVTHPAIIEALSSWLDDVPKLHWASILDLAYIELRLACTMGPAMYSHERDNVFSAYPMNGRNIFSAMMGLPGEWRFQQLLYTRILKTQWPELLLFPLHKSHWTGSDRYVALLQLVRNAGKWSRERRSAFLGLATANRKVPKMVLRDIQKLLHKTLGIKQ